MDGSVPSELIDEGAAWLRAGRVVAFPTETVYGLGADALSGAAVARVYELKARPARNPVIVHVTGPAMAARLAASWPDDAERLARAFWPGPLTLVLERGPGVPDVVTAGRETVGVRAPDHPAALALLFRFGGPIAAPSANRSGGVSPTRAAHVRESFAPEEVLVLDGGACPAGIESTVLLLAGGEARVLRPGPVGAGAIAEVLGRAVGAQTDAAGDTGGLASPGLLARHYAPRTPAVLFGEEEWPGVLGRAARVAVVTHRARSVPLDHVLVVLPGDAPGYAAGLYAAVREADASGADLIAIERPPAGMDASGRDAALWHAVADRLARATSG